MIARSKKEARRFISETYRLTFLDDRPFVRVESAQGEGLVDLFVLSSIHSLHGRDDTTRVGNWEMREQSDVTTFVLTVQSSLWQAKQYRFHCFPRRFTYDVEVEGNGRLAEVNYFGGYYSGQPRWGSGSSGPDSIFVQDSIQSRTQPRGITLRRSPTPPSISRGCLCRAGMTGSSHLHRFALPCSCRRDGFLWVWRRFQGIIASPSLHTMGSQLPFIFR